MANVVAPHIVEVYNKNMGAVDLVGFFMSCLRYNFKQYKWTVTVINALFSICISNAHKLYQKAFMSTESITTFARRCLGEIRGMVEMMDAATGRKRKLFSSSSRRMRRRSSSSGSLIERSNWSNKQQYEKAAQFRTDGVGHYPMKYGSKQQVRCFVCRVGKPVSMCRKCNVPLCISAIGTAGGPALISDTCYYIAHNKAKFK